MRASCRGGCPRYAVSKRFASMYANGFGRCTACSLWFDLSPHERCPCCAMPLRRGPRTDRGNDGGGSSPPFGRVPLRAAATITVQSAGTAAGVQE